jgi:myo-inositol-1(or 4)-monophosphatase
MRCAGSAVAEVASEMAGGRAAAAMQDASLTARFAAAQAIAREAGLLGLRFLADPARLDVRLKGPQDFVSAADRALEELIARRLGEAFPNDAFLGEESAAGSPSPAGAQMLWVVDPIDGTANFVRGAPEWSVSIGLLQRGKPTLGVLYQPAADRFYAAIRGGGATRNGAAINVSGRTSLAGATVGIDYSLQTPAEEHLSQIRGVLAQGGEYRRNGCCTISLAEVAEGRLDAFVELHLNAWDVAAAIVIVEEAGGWTNDFFAGSALSAGNVMIAAAPGIKAEFLEAIGLAGSP